MPIQHWTTGDPLPEPPAGGRYIRVFHMAPLWRTATVINYEFLQLIPGLRFHVRLQRGERPPIVADVATLREQAHAPDRARHFAGVTLAYGQIIASGAGTVDDSLDLAMLYFVIDFGYSAHHRLPEGIEWWAEERMREVFARGVERFPVDHEVAFWRRYCEWIQVDHPQPDDATCHARVTSEACPAPVCILYCKVAGLPDAQRRQYDVAALQNYQQMSQRSTHRARYVSEILSNAQREHGLLPSVDAATMP